MNVMWALASSALFIVLAVEASDRMFGIVLGVALLAGASQIIVPATSGNTLSLGFAVAAAVPFVMRTPGGMTDLTASGAIFVGGAVVSWVIAILRGEDAVSSLATALRRAIGRIM